LALDGVVQAPLSIPPPHRGVAHEDEAIDLIDGDRAFVHRIDTTT
jgi:hypothetical protein